ncbi:MAG: UPF0182 family protein [Acidobacteriota bacterium]
MYILLLLLLIGLAAILVSSGIRRHQRRRVYLGVAVAALTICFFSLLDFWTEMLWFDALGFGRRFWTVVWAELLIGLLAGLFGFIVVFTTTLPLRGRSSVPTWVWSLPGAIIGAVWGVTNWDGVLRFYYRVNSGILDPILSRDAGFYLFTLPFLDQLYWLLLLLLAVSALAVAMPFLAFHPGRAKRCAVSLKVPSNVRDRMPSLWIVGGVLLLVVAFGTFLDHYHLLFSTWGAVSGPGWTDVHFRLPGYWIVSAGFALIGLWLLWGGLSGRASKGRWGGLYGLGTGTASAVALWMIALLLVPGLVQWLRVEPNEITFEKPYIAHNIEFTRRAFGLAAAESQQFPASDVFTPEMAEADRHVLSEVRLWDWRALDAVYKQFQEIRLYYAFEDVDIDRYTFNGRYRQVMVSAREMEPENLPKQSQTFVNRRFKYTHGYGITLTPVNEFTPDGLPDLLVKDIPPKSRFPELEVERPQIYYGEKTDSHVFVNTNAEEFDYPSGEDNRYIRYPGKGGVRLSSFWRKFVIGWQFDGTRLLFSSYPTDQSRVMFHRQIRQRVEALAPFLKFDSDPYIVLSQGKLYWIIDGYTTSDLYPYSEPYDSREVIQYKEGDRDRRLVEHVNPQLDGINYIRNSVKAVVDAFDGTVSFYVFDPADPVLQVWRKIFPGLFRNRSDMPEGLQEHVRYPEGLLLTQGLIYAKYHMTDPEVFYNQEDLWVRATEKYYSNIQPVEPYYIMWSRSPEEPPEFVLMLPFTPKNRQVLIGWIAGMFDGKNYGRFLAYQFPKEKRILGPQQVETKIDQDRYLSAQLSLWDQRGSSVIRGNMLAIPIEKTLLYVEPIYLQAETAAYPELRLVAVMHGDQLSYGETFEQALQGLFEENRPTFELPGVSSSTTAGESLAEKAENAFESYLQLQAQQKFPEAAQQLQQLQGYLQQMVEEAKGPSPQQ